MTHNQFDEVVNRISHRITLVEKKFIQKVANQIKQIGELNPSSINRLAVMLEMNKDIAEITSDLLIATGLNISDMQAIYEKAASDVYTDKRFQRAIESIESAPEAPKSPKVGNERLKHYANSVARQTAEIMANLSNTTIVSQTYRDAVDNAIVAASTGMGSYQEEMRDIVKDLGKNGIQVRYPSGYKRRLDTAVRQNITDGVKQIAQNGSLLMGEELGYDAVEISAHMKSAPDHEPVQGRILKLEEFHKMQDGQPFCDVNGKPYEAFKRRIGEWNCYHIVMSFSTKWSVPRYSEEQLQRWAEDNNAGCFIGGRHYTIYEATQLMRKLETKSRWLKNEAIAAKAAGDEELRHDLQRKINQVSQQYAAVAAASEQPMKKSRMQVQGFQAVKEKNVLPQEENYVITKKPEHNAYSVNRKLVNSKKYHDRFEGLFNRKSVNESVYQQAKRLLENRDGTDSERMIILDSKTGNLITDNLKSGLNQSFRTGISKEQYDDIQSRSSNFIMIHNHPGSTRPSGTDILTFWGEQKADASIIVGHDGSVHCLLNMNRNIPLDKVYKKLYDKYKEDGYDTDFAKIKATNDLYNLNVFSYHVSEGD